MFRYFCGRKPRAFQKLFRGWQMQDQRAAQNLLLSHPWEFLLFN